MARKTIKCRVLKDPEYFAAEKRGDVVDVPEEEVSALVAVGLIEVVKSSSSKK